MKYKGPGKYVAICNKARFDGHYIKQFEIPASGAHFGNKEDYTDVDAAWYFLNRVDIVACVEAVYPLSIFEQIKITHD